MKNFLMIFGVLSAQILLAAADTQVLLPTAMDDQANSATAAEFIYKREVARNIQNARYERRCCGCFRYNLLQLCSPDSYYTPTEGTRSVVCEGKFRASDESQRVAAAYKFPLKTCCCMSVLTLASAGTPAGLCIGGVIGAAPTAWGIVGAFSVCGALASCGITHQALPVQRELTQIADRYADEQGLSHPRAQRMIVARAATDTQ